MKLSGLDRIIYFLFPSWQLNSTPWKSLWIESDQWKAIKQIRIGMTVLGIGYLLHYFFVDRPLGLTVDSTWFYYRFGIATLAMAVLGLTFLKQRHLIYSKIAYWIVGFVTCWAQAQSMAWYSGVSPIWSFFIASGFAILYRSEPSVSLLMLVLLNAIQWPAFLATNQNVSLMVGSEIVSLLLVVLVLRGRIDEIQSFMGNQRQMETEKILAEVQQELADQIRAFLPDKINKDIRTHLRNGASVTAAMDAVLQPRTKVIACLFSDIRGYTKASKQLDFIRNTAIPNIKFANSIVEENDGIPRLIGDLVFAYFEGDAHGSHMLNSFKAANSILKEHIIHNSENADPEKIRRYVILDQGQAVCGNLGGANSSREITALGVPVNRCARIDQLTKETKLREILGDQAIVVSSKFREELMALGWTAEFECVDLNSLGLAVRDFESENYLYITTQVQELVPFSSDRQLKREAS